jgi:two-component system, NtrC family, nitrogen regulation response regulator NtrX
MGADILIVDDERDIRAAAAGILEDEGYAVRGAADAAEAHAVLAERAPDLVILDVWLQGSDKDGLEILADIRAAHPDTPVVMISGHGTIETAVTAIRRGAYDFVEKPFSADRLLLVVRRALEAARLRAENAALRAATQEPCEIVGNAPQTRALRDLVARVGPTGSRVLITGPAGAGKTLVAHALHAAGPGQGAPLITLGCAGADGAAVPRALEDAAGGTLLLDSVGDLSAGAQGALVAALPQAAARVIATAAGPLEPPGFRQDLYYRLAVGPVAIAPLADRPGDIAPLAVHFGQAIAAAQGLPARAFTPAAVAALEAYAWPGNARQLRNAVEWTMILHAGAAQDGFAPAHLPPEVTGAADAGAAAVPGVFLAQPLKEARARFEQAYLAAQLARFAGSITRTAQFVGMERTALHRKLRALGVHTE